MTAADFSFAVRPATRDDADIIAAHRMQLFAGEAAAPADAALEPASERAVVHLLDTGRAGAWVAESASGEPVGSAVLLYVDRLPSRENASAVEGYLAQLHVVEGWRWRGVGMALLQAALADGRTRALGRVRLHSTGAALGFYARCGFTPRNNDLELML
ncbi:MAG: GNAT family N-acetyltransferase [Gemmatimonadetes bacterium]|nr:GNAT family N-acetyltransferase [Gemmatimonadota bacterium]